MSVSSTPALSQDSAGGAPDGLRARCRFVMTAGTPVIAALILMSEDNVRTPGGTANGSPALQMEPDDDAGRVSATSAGKAQATLFRSTRIGRGAAIVRTY